MSNVSLIAGMVAQIAKVVGNWQVGSERARLMYRIEAAQDYVFVNERTGEYKNIDFSRATKLLLHLRKRIFDIS